GGGGGGDVLNFGENGGKGGFGGGGGGGGDVISVDGGGNGGFGGGGAGESLIGLFAGAGGFGAGDGGARFEDPDNAGTFAGGGGGGGAGFGGAIFVRDGGHLTIGAGSMTGGAAAGGSGNTSLGSAETGEDGQGAGTGLFLQGTGVLAFNPGSGETTTIGDSIADEAGLVASGYTPPSGYVLGSWSLAKSGAGTLVLTGDSIYSGTTTVSAGLLRVDGMLAYTATTVLNGGTLGGNGTTGAVAVAAGGTIGAGASPGLLTTGDLALSEGAMLEAEIAGTTAGAGGYDQIAVIGTVDLGNATLDALLLGGFDPAFGDSFAIIDNDGADAVAGTFAGLAEGAQFVASGRAFAISYEGGDGNDVVLTAIQAVIIGTDGKDRVNGSNTVYGQLPATKGADIIKGKGGDDTLSGIAGDDLIYGNGADDSLRGKADNDTLYGGKGKDSLKGGAGDDILDGGPGRDKLTGGSDDDTFVFSKKLKSSSIDTITDFGKGDDVIQLSSAIFKKLGPAGELQAEHFSLGAATGDKAQIVYIVRDGTLAYDKNGAKAGGDKIFAKVDKGTVLDHADFLIA
ncbi:MAG: autotransporter-associated beta strand repeat-containing protein, partial [Bauldia sp.]|nr:autotransporter-associated beta strand repeat-containing protein [Bauldia sp.]